MASSLAESTNTDSLYSAEWNERTTPNACAPPGWTSAREKRVIVDASFREEKNRRSFLKAAVGWGVPGVIIECYADAATARSRLGKCKATPRMLTGPFINSWLNNGGFHARRSLFAHSNFDWWNGRGRTDADGCGLATGRIDVRC